MNRLGSATSPYLLQHAGNPVDWYEWGAEAKAEARRRDVPLLISVGYAACHWCHVMAHESFEDEATAALMNERFVNVKVDREERPDIDAVYMSATQAMTGQGGWPMTVFATPDGKPFYCGTYFPKTPRQGMPSFTQLIEAVTNAWRERREDAERVGGQIAERLSARRRATPQEGPPTEEQLHRALMNLVGDFDEGRGGFGGAPKFPPSMTLEHLLRHHARTGSVAALQMVKRTCDAMARGGIYDQLGGGFARYSVDAHWTVPHFEKMLYDNALLLRVYTHLWKVTRDPLPLRIARETAEWLLREMLTPEGAFASSLDADSDGGEGTFYVWTRHQLAEVLGEDAEYAADLFNVTKDGTFEEGASVLQLLKDPADTKRYEHIRELLQEARSTRTRPGRDDKVVAAWNGLVISALAEYGAVTKEQQYLDAAKTAADLLLRIHHKDGRLVRTSRDGVAGKNAGVLEDYGCVAESFLTLYAVTGETRYLDAAKRLLDTVVEHFVDDDGFHDTADDAEQLVFRPADPTDNASPSGLTAAAAALLMYTGYADSAKHREAAEAALAVVAGIAERAPRFAGWGLAVAEAYADGPRSVAIVGDEKTREELHAVALHSTAPGLVIAVSDGDGEAACELLRDKTAGPVGALAYVCQNFVCDAPTADPARLAAKLAGEG